MSERRELKSYRDLLVWQAAVEVAVACYGCTKAFPGSEVYGMTSQIRRSATSIAANIAEGFGRDGPGQLQQFLKIAQGSLKELETHLIIAGRVGLLGERDRDALLVQCDETGRMLGALIRSTNARI
ncbi:four helix bundle protein [Devosia sp.]|uniref:four helix bundle protein n=1 Tax=Devosia sp. TaxID=1871048 RepID=UPI001AD2C92C|nr:four helix bundle protein [Devosia sp.]MBN9307729.1 four helix bundle protein [Devosia sp.]